MNVVLINNLSKEFHNELKQKLLENIYKETNVVLLFGKSHLARDEIDFMQWIIDLCRKNKLFPTKQTVILPVYNQQQIAQLCLAQLSKKKSNIFEAATSDILDLWKLLFKVAVEENEDLQVNWMDAFALKELREAMRAYKTFLSSSACLDHFSLINLLKEEMRKEDNAILKTLQNILIIIEDLEDFSALDREIFKIIFANASISRISLSTCSQANKTDLNISGIGEESLSPQSECTPISLSINVEEEGCLPASIFPLDETYGIKMSQSPISSRGSVLYIEQLFLSHIRLLLNTRDEMAIVCLLTMPGRELYRKEFNAIKKVAATKNMPIYQTIMSIIMRLQLGGKGYRPDADCPIVKHEKALTQFVDSMLKLQNTLEDQMDGRKGAGKVLSSIKYNLTKLRGQALPMKSIENVYNEMVSVLDHSASSFSEDNGQESPERKSSFSIQTLSISRRLRPTLKHLLHLCDFYAGRNMSFLISDVTGDQNMTQATPLSQGKASQSPFRVPPILSLFKSPDTPRLKHFSPSGRALEEYTPLKVRVMYQNEVKPVAEEKKPSIRFQSCCAWAGENISPVANQSLLSKSSSNPVFGPTLKALGQARKSSKHWKDILAELPTNDQKEEEEEGDRERKRTFDGETSKIKKKNRKRSLLSDITSIKDEPTKAKKKKEAENLSVKRKEDPKKVSTIARQKEAIPKGQRHITAFFKK